MSNRAQKRHFPVVVEKDEDGFYVAANTVLTACMSQGKTIEEALANVQEATELYLEKNDTEPNADPLSSQVSIHLITV